MKFFSIVVLGAFLASCHTENLSDKAIFNVTDIPDSTIVLNKWQVVGPFFQANPDVGNDVDLLAQFGFKEDSISFDEFLKIEKKMANDTSLLDSCWVNKFLSSGKIPSNFNTFFNVSGDGYRGTVYCACVIICGKDLNTRLHYSSASSDKIWLNNELILSDNRGKQMFAYQRLLPIKLKKGSNLLLVKTTKRNRGWEMYASLENLTSKAVERSVGLHDQGFMHNNVIRSYEDSIRLANLFPPFDGVLTILDNKNRVLFADSVFENQRWSKCFKEFPQGLYQARYSCNGFNLVHDFYKGNIEDSIQSIIDVIGNRANSDPVASALMERYSIYQKYSFKDGRILVHSFKRFKDAHEKLMGNSNAGKDSKGWYIRSYLSEIDSSRQFYILHVPQNYNRKNPNALAVVVPAIVTRKVPYLECFRVDNLKLNHFFKNWPRSMVSSLSSRVRGGIVRPTTTPLRMRSFLIYLPTLVPITTSTVTVCTLPARAAVATKH
jgi:hypothetical protein